MLVEERDLPCKGEIEAADPAGRRPTESEQDALVFAWAVAKHTRSDAVVLARHVDGIMRTVAVAAGEVSRRLAIEHALAEAGAEAEGAVLASDGRIATAGDFERIAKAGVLAVAHPGGPADATKVAVRNAERELAILATNVSHILY
jgi:phosphoribosylaminoimidazolecarboxamide formyltransferase/IMP cyclohydrolase